MDPTSTTNTPELLYLLAGDPAELAATVAPMRAADVAGALNDLRPRAAARVFNALPFDLAVQVLDEPALEQEAEIFRLLPDEPAARLIEAMSADQQADLFRKLEVERQQVLMPFLSSETRRTLKKLLSYPLETAGGIMTTETLTVPDTWTVEETLRYIHRVGRVKETVYAAYVVDSHQRLVHVVSLREVMASERSTRILDVGDHREPLSVLPLTHREEVARLISRYNLLAVPVVDADGHVLGIVTVDDVIDVIVAEQTEDVQKFGGLEPLDVPFMQIGFFPMLWKRAGWLSVCLYCFSARP